MTPSAEDGFVVRALEPEQALVLGDAGGAASWALVLEPSTKRAPASSPASGRAMERFAVGLLIELVGHPIHFGTQRRQLLNLKRRAEAGAR